MVHLYKSHINSAAPVQCGCGHIELTEGKMQGHMRRRGCTSRAPPSDPTVPIDRMMRKATQAEQKTYLARKVPVVQSFTLDDEGLDYRDWDVTDAGEEMEELRKRNDTLEKELKRARKINDVLSAELLQPATGVPDSLALRGFDEAWEAAASDTSSAALFPEPPTSTSEDIRITRNVRMWRQSSVEAIKDYNKQLR